MDPGSEMRTKVNKNLELAYSLTQDKENGDKFIRKPWSLSLLELQVHYNFI